jgi:hypothetical protein
MNLITIPEFAKLLDHTPNLSFIVDVVLKTYNIEGDIFYYEMPKKDKTLKDKIRKTARQRKWKLRNLTIIHDRRRVKNMKPGELCFMVTVKTPQEFAEMCNKLQKMRAFL